MWEERFSWPELRAGLTAFSAVVVAVMLFGGARLTLFAPQSSTVRVASLTQPDIDLFPSPELANRAFTGTATAEDIEAIRERAAKINDDLLRRTEREARAGARIVFWGEVNAFVFKEDEPSLLVRAAEVARQNEAYVGVGAGTWDQENSTPLENKLVLFDPRGKLVWENWKAIPVPGSEAAVSALDDGRIKSAETPYGNLAGVVCFDMDFPVLLKQAGRLNTDLMLVPSNDWEAIDPWHSHMARYRAIEQGFNMVRHASNGLSLAADYQGRVLATMDHFTTVDRVLISQVPTRGVRTVYSRIGDSFAWMCAIGLVACAVLARKGFKRV
jgi:apolipoprotein N-acyltransferase